MSSGSEWWNSYTGNCVRELKLGSQNIKFSSGSEWWEPCSRNCVGELDLGSQNM